ncbi:MAG: helix-turn-helix transcriptional regulator [Rubrivivax sp.]|nr:helix-turn-helix transcriptional regulator [Rubrivivax sp.]
MSDPPEPRPGTERYRCGRLELQPAARRLLVDGREARVGARAFDVLLALVERPGRVVGKEELLAAVWPGVVVEEANLAVQVSALRKLLGSGLIATVAGRGYQFTGRLEAVPPVPAAPPADTRAQAPPRAPTPMIGRAAELAALSGLLAQQRLLTVTGPGGIGKTRLAQAWCEGPGAGEPVAWIDLGAIGDAVALRAALPPATADATTWIIDNAEALAGALAEVLPPLLAAAPRLRLLVTSQVPLQLQGEQVFRLGTLPVPPPRATPAQALRHSAVQLFVERARAADPRFELAAGNVSSVVAICRRLDGLPLALELAAARVATIGVNALAAALEAALDAADGDLGGLALLGTASRDKPERQRTLQAALAWSHALLDLQSQRLFRRLGVFAGGFTLVAAQAVVGDDAGDAWSVMNTLGRLVEHSLVARDGGEPPRFRLLDAARLFALAQLERAQEGAEWRARHLAWCIGHLQALHGDPGAPLSAAARAAIAAEAPNWRAALEQAFAPGSRRHEDGARLVAALQPYWRQTGADDEARRWSARRRRGHGDGRHAAGRAAAASRCPSRRSSSRRWPPQQAAARGEAAAAARRIDAALAELGELQVRWLEQAAAPAAGCSRSACSRRCRSATPPRLRRASRPWLHWTHPLRRPRPRSSSSPAPRRWRAAAAAASSSTSNSRRSCCSAVSRRARPAPGSARWAWNCSRR